MADGISRMTAAMIKYGKLGEDITCDVTGPDPNGKYGYWITFWKDKRPHISPLLEVPPRYDSKEESQAAMDKLVQEIRGLDDI